MWNDFRQFAEQFSANSPNNFPPIRRTIFRQIAEHIEMIKEVKNNIQEAKYDKEVEEHCLTFFNSMGLPIKQKSH